MGRFKSDRKGVAALEAALALPVCLIMFFVILETGWQVMTSFVFQNGVQNAARFLETGYTNDGQNNSGSSCVPLQDFLQTLVSDESSGLVVGTNVTIQSLGAGPSAANTVIYQFSYKQPFLTSLASMIANSTGWTHTEKVLVHDEQSQSCPASS
ncbi:MAG: TadE/TadG family type IV pilus assembly protein [Acetobacter sp.]